MLSLLLLLSLTRLKPPTRTEKFLTSGERGSLDCEQLVQNVVCVGALYTMGIPLPMRAMDSFFSFAKQISVLYMEIIV